MAHVKAPRQRHHTAGLSRKACCGRCTVHRLGRSRQATSRGAQNGVERWLLTTFRAPAVEVVVVLPVGCELEFLILITGGLDTLVQ
ncbi:hypothetical protein, partial [Nocardiopsis synnemataformans]|uniref:hypothetical protein n=1 Tax=Nocardiopsis synnemataformans TaxID=61305 RepID=UPI003EBFB067